MGVAGYSIALHFSKLYFLYVLQPIIHWHVCKHFLILPANYFLSIWAVGFICMGCLVFLYWL